MTVHMIDTATGKYIKDVVLPTGVEEEMLPSDYIAKPVDPDQFLSLLQVWLYGQGAK